MKPLAILFSLLIVPLAAAAPMPHLQNDNLTAHSGVSSIFLGCKLQSGLLLAPSHGHCRELVGKINEAEIVVANTSTNRTTLGKLWIGQVTGLGKSFAKGA